MTRLDYSHRSFKCPSFASMVFFVTDMLHPDDKLPITPFLNRDMRHSRGRSSPMPMLLARRGQHHISRTNLLDMPAFVLNPALAGSDDEGLTERMLMPCSPCSRLEGNAGSLNKRRIRCLRSEERRVGKECRSGGWPEQ